MAERIGFMTLRYFDIFDHRVFYGIKTKDRILQDPDVVLSLAQSHPFIPPINREAPALQRTPDRPRTVPLADLKPLMDAYWDMIIQASRDRELEKRIVGDREADRIAAYNFYLARDRMGDWIRALLFFRSFEKAMELHEAYLKSSGHKIELAEKFTQETREQRIDHAALFPVLYQKAVDNPFLIQPKFPNQEKTTPEKLQHDFEISEKHTALNSSVADAREQLSSFLLGRILRREELSQILSKHSQELLDTQRAELWLKRFDKAWQESLGDSQWFRDKLRETLLAFDRLLSDKSVQTAWERPEKALARLTFASWLSPGALAPRTQKPHLVMLPAEETALLALSQDPMVQKSHQRLLAEEGKVRFLVKTLPKDKPEPALPLSSKDRSSSPLDPLQVNTSDSFRVQQQLLLGQHAYGEHMVQDQARIERAETEIPENVKIQEAAIPPVEPMRAASSLTPETNTDGENFIKPERRREPPE